MMVSVLNSSIRTSSSAASADPWYRGRASSARTLRQPLRQLNGSFRSGNGQRRGQCGGRGVKLAVAQARGSQVDAGTYFKCVPIRFPWLRSGRVQICGTFEFAGRLVLGTGNLDEGRACQGVLACEGKPELPADLQQLIAVFAFTRLAGLGDGLAGRAGVTEPRRCPAVLKVQLRGGRPVGQVAKPAAGKIPGLPGLVVPVGDISE